VAVAAVQAQVVLLEVVAQVAQVALADIVL